MDLGKLSVSNGSGEAVRALVTVLRSPGSTVITPNSLVNWPNDFAATTGPLLADGTLDPAKTIVFRGHIAGSTIVIDELAPGYTDTFGSAVGDVVVIKPNTFAQDTLINMFKVAHNDNGTLKAITTNPGWIDLTGVTVSSVLYNGNHSYDVTFSGSVASVLYPRNRMRFQRTTSNNLQSMDFEQSSTQYASKASPTGVNLVATMSVEAQVKLESYTGAYQYIIGRRTGAPGWGVAIDSNGRIFAYGNNGSVEDQIVSYHSVPIDRWVNIAVTWDISTSTAKMYMDGIEIPVNYVANSAAVTFGNAGDLRLAANSTAGTENLDGKMKEVRLFSLVRTQAQIRDGANQSINAASAGLIGYWKGDGNFNDSTTNANNMTAINGAIATASDAPWGIQGDNTLSANIDFGIVHKVNGAVATIQVPEGSTLSTTGMTAVAYSPLQSPFGFASQRGRWELQSLFYYLPLGNVAGTYYSGSTAGSGQAVITLPIGEWDGSYNGNLYADVGAAVASDRWATLSKSATALDDGRWVSHATVGTTSANTFFRPVLTKQNAISATAVTPYYVLAAASGSVQNHAWQAITNGFGLIIKAGNAYL